MIEIKFRDDQATILFYYAPLASTCSEVQRGDTRVWYEAEHDYTTLTNSVAQNAGSASQTGAIRVMR